MIRLTHKLPNGKVVTDCFDLAFSAHLEAHKGRQYYVLRNRSSVILALFDPAMVQKLEVSNPPDIADFTKKYRVEITLRSGNTFSHYYDTLEEANTEADDYEALGHDATVGLT